MNENQPIKADPSFSAIPGKALLKMQVQIMFVILGLLFIGGCGKKKKYETSVSGYVVEKNGTRKLAGAKVYLIEHIYHTYNTEEIRRDSTLSGPDGSYHFDFNLGDGRFTVYAYKEHYYPIENTTNVDQIPLIDLGKKQTHNVKLWPYAWLKIRFLNQSGADGVTVNRLYGEHTGYQIFGVNDATVVGRVRGNEEAEIDYFVFPGNVHHEEHVYCRGLDTTYLEINY